MNDEWMPSFAKIVERPERVEDDPLQLADGALSLDGLQAVYRNPRLPLQMRIRAMVAALPHEVPRLAVTYAATDGQDFATLLDSRLKRIEQMKLIEQQPTPPVEVKAPLPRLADKRYRRI